MKAADLARVRSRLERRRREILEAARRAATAVDELRRAEHDPEPTEVAQSEQLQYDLTQVGEAEQREIGRIDAAIARLEAGAYGVCRTCGEPIDPNRLATLPSALDCADCSSLREEADAVDREAKKRRRTMTPE